MVTFRERMQAVLHHRQPDQVPLAPYTELLPRGDFEREMRNRGMGLVRRVRWTWSECPSVRTEITTQGDITTTTHRTQAGTLTARERTHVSREYAGGGSTEVEGLIKGVADFPAAMALFDDTVYHVDSGPYYDALRDLGEDGIVRLGDISAPYDTLMGYFGIGTAEGLANWAYAQQDHPDEFAELLAAVERCTERHLALLVDSPGDFAAVGSWDGFYGPRQYERYVLPFLERAVSLLHAKGKACALHAHAPQIRQYAGFFKQIGIDVVEAYTPPPFADLPLAEARAAWGPDTVIWVNFPETIFYSGAEATKQYAIDLLRSDRPGSSLVIGFTESGLACITSDEVERIFKAGFRALVEAIEEHGQYPIP